MVKISLLIAIIFLNYNSFSQSYWRIENENGEELKLTITTNPSDKTFLAHSRTDALRELSGTITYMLAKTAGMIKYPEIVHSEGKYSIKSDTTYYSGSFTYLDKSLPLTAKSWNNQFEGILLDKKNRPHNLKGEKLSSDKQLKDYPAIISTTFQLIEKNIWDTNLIKSSDWQNYKKEVNELRLKIADDYELFITLVWLGKKLANIPHEIKKPSKREIESKQNKSPVWKEVAPGKAYLVLNNIPEEKEAMDQLFKDINNKNCETIILDARGRRNMSLSYSLLLANHLISQSTFWGIYLTNKWLEDAKIIRPISVWEKELKNAQSIPYPSGKYANEKGVCLKTENSPVTFKGKVYLLTDKNTSGIAEAFAILMKNEKRATLVGQKTAGSPFLVETFEIDKQYRINIPTAQFLDKNGKNYNGISVEPDLITDEDPLTKVLKM